MEQGEDGQSLASKKKMIGNGTIEPMVLDYFLREMKPLIRNAVQEAVQEEFRKFEEKLSTGGTRNDLPNERRLKLQFVGEVPDTVQTGNELIGKGGECLKLALFDASGHTVTSGRESSARVEIVLLDASSKHDENNITPENFEGRIIRVGDKEKPHFAKIVYIHLDKGEGTLSGLKLGHGKEWTKACNCSLGAMVLQKFAVQEAWTAPFKVIDKRCRHNEKHATPFPYSEVWRLKGIGRDGEPFSRLKENNIKTVLDFRFWLSVNPIGLQKEILCARDCKWNVIVAHAQDCIIDDKKMYSHKSPTEPQTRVIYDAVGELKGVIEDETNFVPIDTLSADKKDRVRDLLKSVLQWPAFAQRYKTSFEDEASLLQQFPSRSSDIDASSNFSIQQLSNGNNLTCSENIHGYQPHLPSPSIISADRKDRAHELPASVLGPSAFAPRDNTSFKDEAALPQQFQSRSSDIEASSNPLIQQLSSGNDLTVGEDILSYQPYLPSPSIISGMWDTGLCYSPGSLLEIGPALNPDPVMFDGDFDGFSSFIDSTGGPETVGGSSSNIHINVEFYRDSATAGGDEYLDEEFLCDCLSQADVVMNERNADKGRKKWKVSFCMLNFTRWVALHVHSRIRKKQRVA